MQLILAILYDTCQVHGGSNYWELRCQNGAIVSDSCAIGKPRAVDNMVSMFQG